MKTSDYYVYVYIDPRNYEEFYYGKGSGSRKNAHLGSDGDSDKAKRIAAIHKEGHEPIIRVIARGLSEREALLVEKTLLWKLGKWTDNVATGHFANKFRPHNTLHRQLPKFDFRNGFYYYNVGEGRHRKNRNWDDYIKFGFISAGQAARFRDSILGFNEGDLFAAYLKGRGFVGVGKILAPARMITDVKIDGRPLLSLPLECKAMGANCDDPERSEYVCLVKWLKTLPRENAKWKPGLYTTTHVRASLVRQPATVKFIEDEFGISVAKLII